jgi:hypothetical protein
MGYPYHELVWEGNRRGGGMPSEALTTPALLSQRERIKVP